MPAVYRISKVFKDHLILSLTAILPAIILFLVSTVVQSDEGIFISYLLMSFPLVYIILIFMRLKTKKIIKEVGILSKCGKHLYYIEKERVISLEKFDNFNGQKVKVWYLEGFNIIVDVQPVYENRRGTR